MRWASVSSDKLVVRVTYIGTAFSIACGYKFWTFAVVVIIYVRDCGVWTTKCLLLKAFFIGPFTFFNVNKHESVASLPSDLTAALVDLIKSLILASGIYCFRFYYEAAKLQP